MLSENEIREKTHIATLELLETARSLTSAHSNLLLGHYDKARSDLFDVIEKAAAAQRDIPVESGE